MTTLATGTGLGGMPRHVAGALDAYSSLLVAAYGMRRLVSTWSGPLVTVRRSSDNATLDLYPAGNGWPVTDALLSWCGPGSAYVTRWWDQSGSGRHADQTTASAQPMLINTGVLITLGGRPAVNVPEGSYLAVISSIPNVPLTVVASLKAYPKSGSTGRRITSFGTTVHLSLNANIMYFFAYAGTQLTVPTGVSSEVTAVLSCVFNGSNSLMSFNGVSSSGNTGSNSTSSPLMILGYSSNALQSIDGNCGEIVILSGSITGTQLRTLEAQISTPRGITVA